MKSNTLLCDLSFYGLHSISEALAIMEIHIKHRYQRVVGTDTREGEEMLAEDVVSPKVVRVFGVPVQVFHLPLLRQLYVSNVLASLELGSTVFKYLIPRTTSFMEEVVERSGGHGFWMVVEVDVRTLDREDVVELREMEGEMITVMVMKMKMKTKTVLGLLLIRSDSVVESLFPCILE